MTGSSNSRQAIDQAKLEIGQDRILQKSWFPCAHAKKRGETGQYKIKTAQRASSRFLVAWSQRERRTGYGPRAISGQSPGSHHTWLVSRKVHYSTPTWSSWFSPNLISARNKAKQEQNPMDGNFQFVPVRSLGTWPCIDAKRCDAMHAALFGQVRPHEHQPPAPLLFPSLGHGSYPPVN